jgi:L-asparagine oxygenase
MTLSDTASRSGLRSADANDAGGATQPLSPELLTLDAGERDELRRLAGSVTADPTEEPERFCRQAALAAKDLPTAIWEHVRAFGRAGSEIGLLVIDGLPLDDDLTETPPDNRTHVGEATITARALAIVNHALGEMVAYEAEGEGRLFQDMVPTKAAAHSQTSLSSGVDLELHTEQAFSDLRPDWVSLACLREAPNAQTYVLTARHLVEALAPEEAAMLREPLWTTGVDGSFRVGGHEFLHGDMRGPFSILHGPEDDPLIRFDQDLDWGISSEAHALRQRIIDIYPKLRRAHILKPGQMLLIDNHRVVHGRSRFETRFDGTDRFIVRSFVVRDLVRSRHARPRNGCMIAARYS